MAVLPPSPKITSFAGPPVIVSALSVPMTQSAVLRGRLFASRYSSTARTVVSSSSRDTIGRSPQRVGRRVRTKGPDAFADDPP